MKIQPLVESLSLAAETVPDFYAAVFDRYFELCPESRELMQHTDNHMRGRMLEQVVLLLLDDDIESLESYFAFEVANHIAYGTSEHMYGNLFSACQQVVQENIGDAWDAACERSWNAQLQRLLDSIHRHHLVL